MSQNNISQFYNLYINTSHEQSVRYVGFLFFRDKIENRMRDVDPGLLTSQNRERSDLWWAVLDPVFLVCKRSGLYTVRKLEARSRMCRLLRPHIQRLSPRLDSPAGKVLRHFMVFHQSSLQPDGSVDQGKSPVRFQ